MAIAVAPLSPEPVEVLDVSVGNDDWLGAEPDDGADVDDGKPAEECAPADTLWLGAALWVGLSSLLNAKNAITPPATSSNTTIAAISGVLLLPGPGGCGP